VSGILEDPSPEKNGRRQKFRAAHAHSPGRERVKIDASKISGRYLSHAAKPGGPHNPDKIALIDNDIGLPEDGPEHQTQDDGGYAQCHPKMGFGCWLIQSANRSNH
jgi:hypothetical protein